MEKRLPFIAAIISGIITWLATALFWQNYLPLATLVLLFAVVVLRFNVWSLAGGFLIGLAIDLHNSGEDAQLRIVFTLLVAGSLLQLIIASLQNKPSGQHTSSISQNTIAALLGIGLAYFIQFRICQPVMTTGTFSIIELVARIFGCHFQFTFGVLAQTNLSGTVEIGPAFLNSLAALCLYTLLISPISWACVFAAISAERFNLLRLNRILSRSFKAFWGLSLAGFITLIIWVILGAISFSLPSSSVQIQEGLVLIAVIVNIYFTAWGAGWGASW